MDPLTDKFEMECDSQISRTSPPKAIIDSSPLQTAMDKNKESLKVKLLMRRSKNQLVEQGIMPSLKTSPAIYEQTRQLERAKTGDMLKAKIKQRPDRMELERRHILEHQEGNIDPSLAEKQRMLQKALLVDHLNSKISHRPGPLELIEKNILHADEPIERIVKEGLVNYTPTDEAVSPGQALLSPESMVCIEDDSLSSEGETQQVHKIQPINVIYLAQPQTTITSEVMAAPCITVEPSTLAKVPQKCSIFFRAIDSVKPESSEKSSVMVAESSKKTISGSSIKNDIKEKIKKKSKNKAISKARSIKFHEYKGPPNAQKHSSISVQKSGETNYQLILKQQSLLEYLEDLCKNPPALPASSKMSFSAKEKEPAQGGDASLQQKILSDPVTEKLNKLKVFQLKRYCKTYNLPVSGSKSSLVDRLKPYLHMMEKIPDFEGKSNAVEALACSSGTQDSKNQDTIEENLLKEQQKRIAELQRQLKKSQEELEQIKQNQKKSEQDFMTQQTTAMSATLKNDQQSEIMQFKGEEINITPLATDKILSEMDIKITVRIDTDTTSTLLKPKSEPNFGDTEIMAIQPQDDKVDSTSSNRFEEWKSNRHLEPIGNASENMSHCNESFDKMVDYQLLSTNETLDKLLGQVQQEIPNIGKSVEHSFKNHVSTSPCSQNNSLTADISSNTLESNSLPTPLVLCDYNDVDLLDFPMHIDDTCENVYPLPKTDNSAFHQAMEVREPECSSNHLKQLNFETEMHTESNDLEKHGRSEEKNVFNDFDALVPSEPFCDMFSVTRNVDSPDLTGRMLSKASNNINDINHNYAPSTTVASTCLLDTQQRHLENFPDPVVCNTVKREWPPNDIYYGSAKYKPTQPPNQQNVQLNYNNSELMNIAGEKISNGRLSFDDSERNSSNLMCNSSINNNSHTGQVSPMDFDSLLSNIDLPITTQVCDRGMNDGNQEKMLYDLQQTGLLDYFNDDYGMQNDSFTCEINNTSY